MTVTQNGEDVTFLSSGKSKEPFKQIKFAGTFSEGGLSGELSWDGQQSSVKFTPIATVDPTLLESYEGLYRFEVGAGIEHYRQP